MQAGCPAHTPLRTVRESFPSYGSSPHKVGRILWTGPLLLADEPDRATWRYLHAAMVASAPLAVVPGRISQRALAVICFSGFTDGSTCFLVISDQTDVGISSALPLALASSVIPMLCPLTRLAVRSAGCEPERGFQRFHVLQGSQDDLGSLYTPAVLVFASG